MKTLLFKFWNDQLGTDTVSWAGFRLVGILVIKQSKLSIYSYLLARNQSVVQILTALCVDADRSDKFVKGVIVDDISVFRVDPIYAPMICHCED